MSYAVEVCSSSSSSSSSSSRRRRRRSSRSSSSTGSNSRVVLLLRSSSSDNSSISSSTVVVSVVKQVEVFIVVVVVVEVVMVVLGREQTPHMHTRVHYTRYLPGARLWLGALLTRGHFPPPIEHFLQRVRPKHTYSAPRRGESSTGYSVRMRTRACIDSYTNNGISFPNQNFAARMKHAAPIGVALFSPNYLSGGAGVLSWVAIRSILSSFAYLTKPWD